MHVLQMIALGVDADFQNLVLAMAMENNGSHRSAPTKGVARMWSKLHRRDEHRFLPPSLQADGLTRRSGQNVDVSRNAVTCTTVEDMAEFVRSMVETFDGVARVDNMFVLDDSQAEVRLHYREFRMHVVWPPAQRGEGCARTFAELAERSREIWDDYQLNVPDDATFSPATRMKHATLARQHLQKLAAEDAPLQFIVETQVLLKPYLAGRKAMHLLHAVIRSDTDLALYTIFKRAGDNDDAGKRFSDVQQEKANKTRDYLEEGTTDTSSLLREAAERGFDLAVQMLLERRGTRVDKADERKRTALALAAAHGHGECVALILARGANMEVASESGASALFMAAAEGHMDVGKMLLKKGADPNQADNDGDVPVYVAASNGHTDFVRELLAHRADKNRQNNAGATPLFVACQKGHTDIAVLLIQDGAVLGKMDNDGDTALIIAAEQGHADVVDELLRCGASQGKNLDGDTPLIFAAQKGHTAIVKALLNNDANPDDGNNDGITPLIYAAQNGHLAVVKALLRKGASKNKASRNGVTPLRSASARGRHAIVRLLTQTVE
jgi:ankyrin repeat protein